jgi:Ni,Fe-hydrogenase I cytochrome b subunit
MCSKQTIQNPKQETPLFFSLMSVSLIVSGILDMYQDISQGMKLENAVFQNTSVVTNVCKNLFAKLFKIFLL